MGAAALGAVSALACYWFVGRIKHRLRLDDLDAIADAATAGAGIAWVPRWLVRERIRQGQLVELFAERPGYPYDVHAVWLQTPHVPRRLRVTGSICPAPRRRRAVHRV